MNSLLYMVKGTLLSVIKLRILRWKNYPGLYMWAQCNHKHPLRGGKKDQRERKDVMPEAEV